MAGLFKQPKRRLKKLLRDGEYTDAIVFGKNLESEYSDDSDFMFIMGCLLYTSPSPRDLSTSRMPSSA